MDRGVGMGIGCGGERGRKICFVTFGHLEVCQLSPPTHKVEDAFLSCFTVFGRKRLIVLDEPPKVRERREGKGGELKRNGETV